jgi:hypothetical protein
MLHFSKSNKSLPKKDDLYAANSIKNCESKLSYSNSFPQPHATTISRRKSDISVSLTSKDGDCSFWVVLPSSLVGAYTASEKHTPLLQPQRWREVVTSYKTIQLHNSKDHKKLL